MRELSRRVSFFTRCNGYTQAIALRGQRAGGVGGVSAGRIFKAVEVNNQLAGLVKAVIGQWSMKKTRCPVGGLRAGFVAQNEKSIWSPGLSRTGSRVNLWPLRVNSAMPGAGSSTVVPITVGIFSMWGGEKRVHAASTLNWVPVEAVKAADQACSAPRTILPAPAPDVRIADPCTFPIKMRRGRFQNPYSSLWAACGLVSFECTADSSYLRIEASALATDFPAVEVSALPPTSRVHMDLSIRVASMALRMAAAASVSPR